MKSHTPQISWHDRQPILSVDIQNRLYSKDESRTSYRLATGGNDSHVIVWKVNIGLNTDLKQPIENLECLAELTQHQRSVNIVRFSPNINDNFLAAGDDDSLIFIWKLYEDENLLKNGSFTDDSNKLGEKTENLFEADVISIEVWKPYKILRGHNQDVTDLSWSNDGQNIVSGSVDNNVFVWDVHRGTKLHKVVKEHSSYVQGVSWDPLSKYIASLSSDRNMLVFNFKNGKTVHKVFKISFEESEIKTSSKLFYDQTLMSFCRRLTFSPGGELLFAPSGILETGPDKYENTVYVFERNSLSRPSFYLPTDKFSVAVSCCPIVFELKKDVENSFKFPYRIVFAVATQDSVLFYDTQQLFPFAFVSQVHYLRLTDLSWSPDGRFLIVTSTDGFSTFVVFEHGELGVPYNGKLLEIDELEPSAIKNISKQNAKKTTITTPVSKSTEKEKTIVATPITTFFKKRTSPTNSPSSNENEVVQIDQENKLNINTNTSQSSNRQVRRISLITLFTPNQSQNKSEKKEDCENKSENFEELEKKSDKNEEIQIISDKDEEIISIENILEDDDRTGMKRKLSEYEGNKQQ